MRLGWGRDDGPFFLLVPRTQVARALRAGAFYFAWGFFRDYVSGLRGVPPKHAGWLDRDRGESHDSSPPTPPYIRVRIRRFDRLSTVGVSRRAGESDSRVRRRGFGPFERRIRASPFLIAAKASDLDIRPHGRFEVSTSKRPSIVQAFSETRSAYYAFC